MPRLDIRIVASAFLVSAMVACGDGSASRMQSPLDGAARANVATTQSTLDAQIRALVTNGFPKGIGNAILAHWDQAVRAAGQDPKTTLKGKTVPGSNGRSELVHTLSFLQLKANDAKPAPGETPAHLVARIALDMSLYIYGGAATPVPTVAPTADVAFAIVQPTAGDTVVTPAQRAAVIFPANSVSEPTVVVVTPDTLYYPENCTGPLVTHLCQYPRFYRFNVFPDVRLNVPAKVQVCHVDAGSTRAPLANHDRFLFAHDKPASPDDYVPNGQIVDSIEILPLVSMGITHCQDNGGTTYNTALIRAPGMRGMLAYVGARMVRGASTMAKALLVPKDAWAIDQGGGGSVMEFSTFAVIDPQSTPDLAQSNSPSSRFSLQGTSAAGGGQLSTNAWVVTNAGSGTSGAFTSDLIVAYDTLLTSPVSTANVGGASSLTPRATFGYAAQTVTMPATPGSYFVGTRINVTGPDSSASDNLVSVRVTVSAVEGGNPPDVAVTNQSDFTVTPTTIMQGSVYNVSAYTFSNVGGGTTPGFIARIGLATDTALTQKLQWVQSSTSQVTLTVGQSFTMPASTLAMSPCQAPGSYYIGPKADQVHGPDVNGANDFFSRQITVTSQPQPTGQAIGSSPWSASGHGTVAAQVNPHCVTLSYDFHGYNTYDYQTFEYTTTAVATGTYTYKIHYSGLHCWYHAYAGLDVFVNSPSGQQVISVDPWTSVYDFFDFGTVTVSVPLTAGYTWGVRAHGQHFDLSQFLGGTIQITEPPQ